MTTCQSVHLMALSSGWVDRLEVHTSGDCMGDGGRSKVIDLVCGVICKYGLSCSQLSWVPVAPDQLSDNRDVFFIDGYIMHVVLHLVVFTLCAISPPHIQWRTRYWCLAVEPQTLWHFYRVCCLVQASTVLGLWLYWTWISCILAELQIDCCSYWMLSPWKIRCRCV